MTIRKKTGLGVTGLLMLAGLVAWVIQYREGLVLTHLQNSYSWGLYISTLAFFVGNAAGGLVLSSMIYLFGVTELKPFARIGALAAFANVTAAMLIVLPDMGQPFRVINLLLHPQFLSPLIWDIIVLSLYAGLSLTYLVLLMLPDIAAGPFKGLLPSDPEAFSDRWARRIAPFSLVAAIGIHVVTAWIFATQGAREWWHSAVMAPDFVAAAMASGTAFVMLIALMAYGLKEGHRQAYRIMAVFIAVCLFIHLFLMYNDFVINAWYGNDEALGALKITLQENLGVHLYEVLAPLAGVILLLNRRARERAGVMMTACLLLVSGIFAHRLLIMPAAFNHMPLTIHPFGIQNLSWPVPVASGRFSPMTDTFVSHYHYFPSAVEIVITLGVMAYACFLLIIAIDRLPILKKADS
ncbi:MAG: NrfD/PsrC family molybdoenzyme membrane anchor subunit [Thermodesulfobacteriota bacterium]